MAEPPRPQGLPHSGVPSSRGSSPRTPQQGLPRRGSLPRAPHGAPATPRVPHSLVAQLKDRWTDSAGAGPPKLGCQSGTPSRGSGTGPRQPPQVPPQRWGSRRGAGQGVRAGPTMVAASPHPRGIEIGGVPGQAVLGGGDHRLPRVGRVGKGPPAADATAPSAAAGGRAGRQLPNHAAAPPPALLGTRSEPGCHGGPRRDGDGDEPRRGLAGRPSTCGPYTRPLPALPPPPQPPQKASPARARRCQPCPGPASPLAARRAPPPRHCTSSNQSGAALGPGASRSGWGPLGQSPGASRAPPAPLAGLGSPSPPPLAGQMAWLGDLG